MSSSTATGCVTEDHRHFISIMAIDRVKRSAGSSIIKKPCGPRTTNCSRYKGQDERGNIVRCKELHLCGGPGGDIGNEDRSEKLLNSEPGIKTKGTQTDYRESETQTIPWEVPYEVAQRSNANPELLSLVNSTWGNGLPAGIHEVQIIRRMRIKRAWLEALPPMDCPENIKIRETVTAAIEANEWAFREAEIQCIMDTRMELMERIANNKTREHEEKTVRRIEKYAELLSRMRDKQIRKIRINFSRQMRKLNVKHRETSARTKNRRPNYLARYTSAKSNFCTKESRSGEKKEEIDEFSKATETNDKTNWLPIDQDLFVIRKNLKTEELCPRETRWNDEKLRKLHADLKAIRLKIIDEDNSEVPSLLKRRPKIPKLPVTPTIVRSDKTTGYWDDCSLFVQKITRGRAVQCMMFEGRNRCRELIEELQSTRAVQNLRETNDDEETNNLMSNLRENDEDSRKERVYELLDSLEGMTVAGMLDMLSKEDTRLREERRAHGFALLAERERNRREAEESGRRQLERNRRRELDEMFRQIVKVDQDSVEVYLEDVIKDGIDWISNEQARRYVVELADKIDASTSQSLSDENSPKDAELITDMIHNFLLPQVDKEMMRKKIRSTQRGYMSEARQAIYDETVKTMEKLNISTNERDTDDESSPKKENSSLEEINSNE